MLHIETTGQGPDLLMVHGWGMHSSIWTDWAELLAQRFRVHLVDLPGHGCSPDQDMQSLEEWAEAVQRVAPDGAWWLGWSLGGLVAMTAARLFSDKLRGLVLLSSTPKFVKSEDWPCAVDAGVFNQFAAQLDEDIERTLMRFLALQVRGSDNSGAVLRKLRSQMQARPRAQVQALSRGLDLLQQSDLRQVPDGTDMPLHWLFGARDTLVPAAVGAEVKGVSAVIDGAGHAPFLSHPQACAEQLYDWLLAGEKGVDCANY